MKVNTEKMVFNLFFKQFALTWVFVVFLILSLISLHFVGSFF